MKKEIQLAKVGNKIRFTFMTAAISCQSSRRYTGTGKIIRLAKPKEHDWEKDLKVFVVKEFKNRFTLVRYNEVIAIL
ncbi:hypothetical protein M0R04_06435 [Candidatus Dojkabacteria bacterium]|jgi:hypothetical protein|nr:hypothetical protein [Candidatus Dojkabacteria bacterium]